MSTLILTQNNNVARHLEKMEQTLEYQKDKDAKAWVPRLIKTVDAWINLLTPSLMHEYDGWTVLSDKQEHMLWYRIISEWQENTLALLDVVFDEEERRRIALLNPDATAYTAAKCWQRLREYLALETPYLKTLDSVDLGLRLWKFAPSFSASEDRKDRKDRSFWHKTRKEAVKCSDAELALFYLEQLNGEKNVSDYDPRQSAEFRPFLDWQHRFQELCGKNNWIDKAALPSLLTAFLRAHDNAAEILKLPQEIVAYGFINAPDEFAGISETDCSIAPQTVSLLKALAGRISSVTFAQDLQKIFDNTQKASECRFTCLVRETPKKNAKDLEPSDELPKSIYETDTDEFYAAAKQAFELTTKDDKPHNIGIIVPKLDECRGQIISCLDEILCKQTVLPEYSREPRPYTISLGQKLSETPMISSALTLFSLLQKKQDIQTVANFINSPYICGFPEGLNDCAGLDTVMRGTQKTHLSLQELCALHDDYRKQLKKKAEKYQKSLSVSDSYKYFCNNLRKVQTMWETQAAGAHKTYSEWGSFFLDVLRAVHWPVRRLTRPEEYKLSNTFLTLIHSSAELDLVTENAKITYGDALETLKNFAGAAIYQPPAAYKAPIHVSGILEAVGLSYEHVFIMNYTDQVWPSISTPLPYLPMQLQTSLHMPGTETDVIEVTHWINRHLGSLAPTGTISFSNSAVENKNRRDLHVSRLIKELNCEFATGSSAADWQPWYRELISRCFSGNIGYLEDYRNDDPLPPLQDVEGGSSLIQNQLDCPFKALVAARWVKDELDEAIDSPDPLTKGTIVHAVMENLWIIWDHKYSNFKACFDNYQKGADKTNGQPSGTANKIMPLEQAIAEAAAEGIQKLKERYPDCSAVFGEPEQKRFTELWLDGCTRKKLDKALTDGFEKLKAQYPDCSEVLDEQKQKLLRELFLNWFARKPLDEVIAYAVTMAVKGLQKQRPDFGAVFYELEAQRLIELLLDWFTRIEPERHKGSADFQVACEKEVELKLGGRLQPEESSAEESTPSKPDSDDAKRPTSLALKLRLDRIDILTDPDSQEKNYYLSDYKTSNNYNISEWCDKKGSIDAPPQKAQLPLYAVYIKLKYGEEALRGLGYDRLVSKKKQNDQNDQPETVYDHSFLALMRNEEGKADTENCEPVISTRTNNFKYYHNSKKVKGKTEYPLKYVFNYILDKWNDHFEQAGNDFLNPNHEKHAVAPRSKSSCDYCSFKPICRHRG